MKIWWICNTSWLAGCVVIFSSATNPTGLLLTALFFYFDQEYVLRIQRGPVAEKNWTITKRYNDFVTLDSQLKLAGFDLTLPPKKVFGNMEREFIAERQHGLQVCQSTCTVNDLITALSPIIAPPPFVKK